MPNETDKVQKDNSARLGAMADILTAAEDYDAERSEYEASEVRGERSGIRKEGVFGRTFRRPKAFEHAAHVFGYLAPAHSKCPTCVIQGATEIDPDPTMVGAQVKITLDRLRVAAYPGEGRHRILFDFLANNQVDGDKVEQAHFNSHHSASDGDDVAVIGYPLFVGLSVGSEGLAFHCSTVNIGSSGDEEFLRFLDEDAFKSGLQLAEKANPVVGLLSRMAVGLTRALAGRSANKLVQDFHLGLDVTTLATRARLREGSYMAIQVPSASSTQWNWSDYSYSPSDCRIIAKNTKQIIPWNYIIVGVSRMRSQHS